MRPPSCVSAPSLQARSGLMRDPSFVKQAWHLHPQICRESTRWLSGALQTLSEGFSWLQKGFPDGFAVDEVKLRAVLEMTFDKLRSTKTVACMRLKAHRSTSRNGANRTGRPDMVEG